MIFKYMDNTILEILDFHTRDSYPFRPGIYVLGDESGTGKTRLYKLLSYLKEVDKRVTAYTYSDIKLLKSKAIDLQQALTQTDKETQVIMFDRADLYIKDIADAIEELKDRYMILIDCKTEPLGESNYCNVVLDSPNKVTVLV